MSLIFHWRAAIIFAGFHAFIYHFPGFVPLGCDFGSPFVSAASMKLGRHALESASSIVPHAILRLMMGVCPSAFVQCKMPTVSVGISLQ